MRVAAHPAFRHCARALCAARLVPTIGPMKTYDIELLRVKSMHQGHGLVYMRLDATVQPQPKQRDDDGTQEPATVLKLTEENARVLLLLLKQQLSEFDKKKPKSRF